MSDIEKRLITLERRAQKDSERWDHLAGELMGLKILIEATIRPLAAINPEILPVMIGNLKFYMNDGKLLNVHASTISRIRGMIVFLEKIDKKIAEHKSLLERRAHRRG